MIRIIAIFSLSIVALLSGCAAITMPLALRSQAVDDRNYYEQFRAAAQNVDAELRRSGRLGEGAEVGEMRFGPKATTSILLSTGWTTECGQFEKAEGDRFVLSFWRGEWSECYAYPSGRTTLSRSFDAYLSSGLGMQVVVLIAITIAAAWAAITISRIPRYR